MDILDLPIDNEYLNFHKGFYKILNENKNNGIFEEIEYLNLNLQILSSEILNARFIVICVFISLQIYNENTQKTAE